SQQAPASQASQQTPTFKTQVEYVEVDALVTDQQGNFVRDLTKNDFQVFEDGKRQTISTFSLVDIPIERFDRPLFSPTPIERDVQSNERPFDGRVYVLILDDLHVAPQRTARVRTAARQFIQQRLGANDLMAVIFTGGRSQDAQEFTSNKRLLLNAVDKFTGQKLESAVVSRNNEYFRQRDTGLTGRVDDPNEQERVFKIRSTLTSLRQVADWFGGVHGRRKTMLFFSEGIDYDLTDIIRGVDAPQSSATTIMSDIQDAIAATARSNVSIYSIDPRGLTDGSEDAISVGQFADQDDPVAGRGIGQGGLANELRVSQDSLRQLSDQSGGFAAVNRNDLSSAFERIVRDNSSYYVLAYYPPSDKRDGKFHRIEVRVVDRPGLIVRSRRGYNAPRGKPAPVNTKTGGMPQDLFDAINSPLQVSGLTMRVFAAPFKGAQPNSSVLVGLEMLGRDLSLETNSKVDISYMAVDTKAKIFGARTDSITMNLRPDTKTRVEQTGFRVLNRMELPPGRYQLRLAARDTTKATIGSVIYDLDVPDFYKDKIAMSGLAITSLGGAAMMTARPDDVMKQVLPAPPVAARAFAQNDELAVFTEVYDNSGNAPHKVDITTSVLTDEGRVLYKNEESRDSSELQGAKGGYGYTSRVPLSEIVPGSYVLNVEARSRLGDNLSTKRQVQFTIVPATR
ncbi:MAG TPA: VWA domain-containing protein, partial [Vicinamibacterales bacterium]